MPDFIVIFLIFNDVLVSSTLTLPVNIFTWKKGKPCSSGATKFFSLIKKKVKNRFTRKMFRIFTFYLKRGGLFSILAQDSQKVTKKC